MHRLLYMGEWGSFSLVQMSYFGRSSYLEAVHRPDKYEIEPEIQIYTFQEWVALKNQYILLQILMNSVVR